MSCSTFSCISTIVIIKLHQYTNVYNNYSYLYNISIRCKCSFVIANEYVNLNM